MKLFKCLLIFLPALFGISSIAKASSIEFGALLRGLDDRVYFINMESMSKHTSGVIGTEDPYCIEEHTFKDFFKDVPYVSTQKSSPRLSQTMILHDERKERPGIRFMKEDSFTYHIFRMKQLEQYYIGDWNAVRGRFQNRPDLAERFYDYYPRYVGKCL